MLLLQGVFPFYSTIVSATMTPLAPRFPVNEPLAIRNFIQNMAAASGLMKLRFYCHQQLIVIQHYQCSLGLVIVSTYSRFRNNDPTQFTIQTFHPFQALPKLRKRISVAQNSKTRFLPFPQNLPPVFTQIYLCIDR